MVNQSTDGRSVCNTEHVITGLPNGDDLTDRVQSPLLAAVDVIDLFGRYTYHVDVPHPDTGQSRLLLLYGDNGSGKTTLLNLLFHLLSPAPDRGHRTYLLKVPFRSFGVTFTDGTRIVANRDENLLGTYSVSLNRIGFGNVTAIFEADEPLRSSEHPSGVPEWYVDEIEFMSMQGAASTQDILFEHMPPGYRQAIENRKAQDELIRYLRDSEIRPVFLADDRSVYSDDEDGGRLRSELRRSTDIRRRDTESAGELVSRELRIAVGRVNEWLRTMALRGQNVGSAGANSIYLDVLRKLAHSRDPGTSSQDASDEAMRDPLPLVNELAERSPRFEEFELVPHFDSDEFRTLLEMVPEGETRRLAQTILSPYLTSLQARIDGLEEAEQVLRVLLSLLNSFLVDKKFTFSPRAGLKIQTPDGGTLAVESLSSGERQLTMLLCSTLLARRGSRLFLIDEPELSLGVRWQRTVVQALLDLTDGSSLQFVVATHSVEIITSANEYLVPLERQGVIGA